jgi:hypothetical protein
MRSRDIPVYRLLNAGSRCCNGSVGGVGVGSGEADGVMLVFLRRSFQVSDLRKGNKPRDTHTVLLELPETGAVKHSPAISWRLSVVDPINCSSRCSTRLSRVSNPAAPFVFGSGSSENS